MTTMTMGNHCLTTEQRLALLLLKLFSTTELGLALNVNYWVAADTEVFWCKFQSVRTNLQMTRRSVGVVRTLDAVLERLND